jgi:hypothetical protein
VVTATGTAHTFQSIVIRAVETGSIPPNGHAKDAGEQQRPAARQVGPKVPAEGHFRLWRRASAGDGIEVQADAAG